MIDATQILLIIVVSVLTVLLTVIGIQVFFILREVQQSIKKTNKILDDTGTISESVARPISSLSNSLAEISGITSLLGWLASRKKRKEKEGGKKDG